MTRSTSDDRTGLPQPEDAAARCGVHYDTIRRYRKEERLPNSVERNGAWYVSVSDLVDAGLLDPFANHEHVEQIAQRTRTERDLIALRQEHAVLQARYDATLQRAERAEAEVAFLRALAERQAVA